MTSRMHAAHTTCPACREEVYLDELVKGRCPLCGCTLEELDDGESVSEELIERCDFSWLVFNYFIFKKFDEMGVSPVQIMQFLANYEEPCVQNFTGTETAFEFELPSRFIDRVRPKRCGSCGRIYIRGGKKIVRGDLARPGLRHTFRCPRC